MRNHLHCHLKVKMEEKVTEAKPSVHSPVDCSFPKDLSKEAFRRIAFSGLASRLFHHISRLFHRSIN